MPRRNMDEFNIDDVSKGSSVYTKRAEHVAIDNHLDDGQLLR